MARLYISGYRWLGYDINMSPLPAPSMPALFEDNIILSLAGTLSRPFPKDTKFICIKSDEDCWLAISGDPEAIVGVHPIAAGERLFYGVIEGQRLAAILGEHY